MKKITRELAEKLGFDFDLLIEDFQFHDYEPRKGSSFFATILVEINEEWFPEVPRELDGLYLSNRFVHDSIYGCDKIDIQEFKPVKWVTKIVEETSLEFETEE